MNVRLLVINPNATEAMTETIAAGARAALGPAAEVVALTNHGAPPAIQGAADGEAAVPFLLELVAAHARAVDAVVIACFDDTGLDAARRASPVPVVGIGEAAFHAACLFGGRFSVVTTLAVSVPVIEANVARYGLGAACARVRASGVPVLDIDRAPDDAVRRIGAEIERAAREDGVSAVALGCAGMTAIAARLPRPAGVTLVDSTAAGALLGLAAARLAQG